MKSFSLLAAASALALLGSPAVAADFVVSASGNSSSGGAGLDTGLAFTAGDMLVVSVDADDLWSAGALPRWSNADGLTGNRYATGSDESGQPAGTLIGADFGLWNQGGLSAPFGSLVGRLGGVFQLLGTGFSGPAWANGTLELFYWDSNSGDNSGRITVSVNAAPAIPEPATWAMMIGGLALAGVMMRRSRATVSFA
jgi:hypothetical protein